MTFICSCADCIYKLAYCLLPCVICMYELVYCLLPCVDCMYELVYWLLPCVDCMYELVYCLLPCADCMYELVYCLLPCADCMYELVYCLLPFPGKCELVQDLQGSRRKAPQWVCLQWRAKEQGKQMKGVFLQRLTWRNISRGHWHKDKTPFWPFWEKVVYVSLSTWALLRN